MSVRRTRLLKEISLLKLQAQNEWTAILIDNFDETSSIESLAFELSGPDGTPFAAEKLKLDMKITERYTNALLKIFRFIINFRYPFEPPIVRFITPVAHPNVDEATGRICLDLLRMPPEGSWRPNVSLGSVLVSVQVLLGAPNLEDPVRPDLITTWNQPKEVTAAKANVQASGINDKIGNKRPFSLSLTALRKKPKQENLE